MSLRKPPAAQFEDDNTPAPGAQTVAAEATKADKGPSVEAAAGASAQASTAIATASATSKALVAGGGKFTDFFAQFENALPELEFGTLPRLIGAQGGVTAKLTSNKTIELGKSVEMTLLSFNDRFTVSPGDDSDEAKKLVRYSRDGVTIESSGESVAAYLENLRTVEGFTEASCKKYVSLVGILETVSDKDGEQLIGSMVEAQLSPQGVTDFKGYRLQKSVKIARGAQSAEGADRVTVAADKRSGNGKNWTVLQVGDSA